MLHPATRSRESEEVGDPLIYPTSKSGLIQLPASSVDRSCPKPERFYYNGMSNNTQGRMLFYERQSQNGEHITSESTCSPCWFHLKGSFIIIVNIYIFID